MLKAGKVIEEGTHAELLARDGVYRRLHRIQFASALADPEAAGGARSYTEVR